MAEMGWLEKRLVNLRSASRSRRLLSRVAPALQLPPAPRLLEVGAGAGGLSAALFERFEPSRLVATDFDPEQLAAARRNLARRLGGIPPNLELRTADALALPFGPGSFDAVFAIQVFHHVELEHSEFVRRPQAVREVRRVLAPGGLLVYSDFSRKAELRRCLRENGFTPVLEQERWRHALAVLRSAGPGPPA